MRQAFLGKAPFRLQNKHWPKCTAPTQCDTKTWRAAANAATVPSRKSNTMPRLMDVPRKAGHGTTVKFLSKPNLKGHSQQDYFYWARLDCTE